MQKSGKDYFLRIYIDKETGIDLSDCEKVSNEINDILDKENYIEKQYFLEVSSPGIERILRKDKHLEESIGKEVEIKLFRPMENTKQLSGTLISFDKEKVCVEIKSQEKEIERKQIAQIKLKYNW